MTTDAVKKIQGKIFRGDATPTQLDETRDTGLAIVIPKPPPTPVPPPKLSSGTGQKHSDDAFPKSHRDRLAQELAGEYRGAERHRLLQDEKRERHWKKWGPYLSDRQWVSNPLICAQVLLTNRCLVPRQPFARIIPQMATPGLTFPTNTHALARIDGVKMESLEYPTTTSAFVLAFPSGTARMPFSRNACLE